MRIFAGGDVDNIYDPSSRSITIQPFSLRPNVWSLATQTPTHVSQSGYLSIATLSDSAVLQQTSTSPFAEAPSYPATMRRLFSAIATLTTDDVFPGRNPRVYARGANGEWVKQ